jgi:RNA polymerase sigma-70 factor (ECF subfamily)
VSLAADDLNPPAGPQPSSGDRHDDAHRRARDLARVQRFRAGERGAFDDLVRDHQRIVLGVCHRWLGNRADAQEICQRTFVAALRGLGGFRGEAGFRAWLLRIAINLCMNHRRDRRREVLGEVPDAAVGVVEATGAARFVAAERARELGAAIAALPRLQRLVVELRIYEELSFREIAALADTTENAAKVSFHHALKRLRGLLAGAREGDET